MQKNKKVFVSFDLENGLFCIDVDTIVNFQEQARLDISDPKRRRWLRIETTQETYQLFNIKAQELIDQMTNVEIRGAYAKK